MCGCGSIKRRQKQQAQQVAAQSSVPNQTEGTNSILVQQAQQAAAQNQKTQLKIIAGKWVRVPVQ